MVEGTSGRPEPSASGHFAKTPFPHVLLFAYERGLTGSMELHAPPEETATIVFVEGRPAKVRTSEPVAFLGRVLLELGTFDEDQLTDALLTAAQHRRLIGQTLLSSGLLSREQLDPGLVEQLGRRLRYLARLPVETEFRYYDGVDALEAYGGPARLTVDPFPFVWAAIRDAPSWEHARATLGRAGRAGLRLSVGAALGRFEMSRGEQAMAELLRTRPRTVQEVTSLGVVDPRAAQLVLYCLLVSKQVELLSDSQSRAPAVARPSARPSSRPTAPPPPVVTTHFEASPFSSRPAPAPRVPFSAPPAEGPAGSGEDILVLGKGQLEVQVELTDPGPAFEASERGQQYFKEAHVLLGSGQLKKAEAAARTAAECSLNNAEYLAFYGWVMGKGAESKLAEGVGRVPMELAIEKLDKALRLNPNLARAYYYRGVLQGHLERVDEALEDLKRALILDPKDPDAPAEVRLIETRKEERRLKEEAAGKGLLGKLFRK
jgi:hypothetical protein